MRQVDEGPSYSKNDFLLGAGGPITVTVYACAEQSLQHEIQKSTLRIACPNSMAANPAARCWRTLGRNP
jgi:hypothetical protein